MSDETKRGGDLPRVMESCGGAGRNKRLGVSPQFPTAAPERIERSGDVDEALRLAAWLEKVSASYDPVGPEYLNAARLLRRFAQSSTTECTWSFNGWICRACISLGGCQKRSHTPSSKNQSGDLDEARIEELRAVILADRENWPSKAYPAEINALCDLARRAQSSTGRVTEDEVIAALRSFGSDHKLGAVYDYEDVFEVAARVVAARLGISRYTPPEGGHGS